MEIDEKVLQGIYTRLERMEAYNEIMNLMARYEWIHTASDQEGNLHLYALKTPGVRQEFSQRVFDGKEGIERNLIKWQNAVESDLTGSIFQHDLVNPYVVVADDAQTAIGMWNSIGMETLKTREGKIASIWCWCKYKVDFIKEDGEWKFWHFRFYPIVKTRFDGEGWGSSAWIDMKEFAVPGGLDRGSKEFAPDRLKYVCSFRNDRVDCDVHNNLPEIPPVHYATWQEEWNAVDREAVTEEDYKTLLTDSYPPINNLKTQKDYK